MIAHRIQALLAAAVFTGCAVAQSPIPDASTMVDRDGPPPLDRDLPRPDRALVLDADPEPDGAPMPDAGVDLDAAAPDPDMMPLPDPDMAPPEPDMAPLGPDMAPPEPDMAPPAAPYAWLIIVDDSMVENMNGTPGADLCGASADCGDGPVTAIDAEIVEGDGLICDGVPNGVCGDTARDQPQAALDDGAECEPASDPSHYVSLGVQGELALNFDRDLVGCRIRVVEYAGFDIEPYVAFVCQTPTLEAETCRLGGEPLASAEGGDLDFVVP